VRSTCEREAGLTHHKYLCEKPKEFRQQDFSENIDLSRKRPDVKQVHKLKDDRNEVAQKS
jgi:hypothetical protein